MLIFILLRCCRDNILGSSATLGSLVIFDNCTDFTGNKNHSYRFAELIGKVLSKYQKLRLIVTSKSRITSNGWINEHEETYFSLQRLTTDQSARLLLKILPRELRHNDWHPLRNEKKKKGDVIDELMQTRQLQRCRGNPSKIHALAEELKNKKLKDISL